MHSTTVIKRIACLFFASLLFIRCDLIPLVKVSTDKIELDYHEQSTTVDANMALYVHSIFKTNLTRSKIDVLYDWRASLPFNGEWFSISLNQEMDILYLSVKENDTDTIRCIDIYLKEMNYGTGPCIEVNQHPKP
ncbi:MAG: hypothetical protein IJ181_10700 [Acidaminococcaceae bacterium]|nr:hypothetical protein [Acidaminococcaceae bacterium]